MSKLKLNINDKRALSNVVATFLILLLSMIAIGIVYGTVSNILYSIKYSPTLSCIDIMVKNPIEIVSSCYNAETKKIEVELRRSFGNVEINDLGGLPVIHIKRTPLDGWGRIVKRVMDIILSLSALIVLIPVFILCAIIIKLDSRGTVFVKLIRLGDGGKKFELYKFRSMVKDAHKMKTHLSMFNERGDGPLFKMKHDPRITRFGGFIRKWSIDEFPNFINVLKGDVSLIGPRPHEPEEVRLYSGYQKRLLNIKPGVTGLAQISGRSNLSFDEEARLDLFYIENWHFSLDVSILLRTPWVMIRGKNAV
ncbi:MAG: hypothetical protein COY02_02120 [Parcubacteria group bacterium CG_4_10_14_0_2_um_filter_41_6]|nr:MAG: hypothetical protein COY02_02120 [Parcubacteria group bacterium CG_4_10_14_0_2_um_filter_41_6]